MISKSIIVLKSLVGLSMVLSLAARWVSLSWGKNIASGSSCSIALKIAPTSTPWFCRACFGAILLSRTPNRLVFSSKGHLIVVDFLERTSVYLSCPDGFCDNVWCGVLVGGTDVDGSVFDAPFGGVSGIRLGSQSMGVEEVLFTVGVVCEGCDGGEFLCRNGCKIDTWWGRNVFPRPGRTADVLMVDALGSDEAAGLGLRYGLMIGRVVGTSVAIGLGSGFLFSVSLEAAMRTCSVG